MNERTLNIKVGKLPEKNLERAVRIMESLDRGEQPEPYFAIGFASMAQFLRIFTPRRWQALAMLREQGPLTIAELAQQLQRDYKNVHGDVEKLIEWQAIVKDEQGYISAPYSEIVVDVLMPQGQVA